MQLFQANIRPTLRLPDSIVVHRRQWLYIDLNYRHSVEFCLGTSLAVPFSRSCRQLGRCLSGAHRSQAPTAAESASKRAPTRGESERRLASSAPDKNSHSWNTGGATGNESFEFCQRVEGEAKIDLLHSRKHDYETDYGNNDGQGGKDDEQGGRTEVALAAGEIEMAEDGIYED
jgi:hypothetical protein